MPRKKRFSKRASGPLAIVRQAREAAKSALQSLSRAIEETRSRLDALLTEERSFREELFGGGTTARQPRRVGRPPGRPPGRRRARTATPRRKGPPRAEGYFKKLPTTFTIDHVRKIAGRGAAISLAQWSRSKRIRKTANGYQKTGK